MEVYAGTYEGACTFSYDPPPWWRQYPYPQWSWEYRWGWEEDGDSVEYYCTADPINLVWYRSDGRNFADLGPILSELDYHGWDHTWAQDYLYVYDPGYGWEEQGGSRDKHYPGGKPWERYHVRLWLVHRCGYGRVDVVGQAHVDLGFPHEAFMFEDAEQEVREVFQYPVLYRWRIAGWVWLGNYIGDPEKYNNGLATEIAYLGRR